MALRGGLMEIELTQGKNTDELVELAGQSGLNHFFHINNIDKVVNLFKDKGVYLIVESKQITDDIRAVFFEESIGERAELCALSLTYPSLRKS